MKELLQTALVLILSQALLVSVYAEPTGMEKMKMMRHVTPMPPLMMVVKHHADELSLTDEQNENLAKWRETSAVKVAALAKETMAGEKQITEAALKGESTEVIQKIASNVMEKRMSIIKIKIQCRDNMKKILNDEQWEKVVALYTKDHL